MSSLQPMSHTVTIQDLTKAGQEAITTVMGPDQASLQELLTTNPELLAQLAQTAQNAASTNQVSDELVDTIKQVQQSLIKDKAHKFKAQLQITERELTAINGATGAAAERLKRAESTFTKSVQFINKTIISIGKVDRKIAAINNKSAHARQG